MDKPKREGKKPGPASRLPAMVKTTILIEPEQLEWGKNQPGGLSALVRRLLREARKEGLE
jgi:hypothetical protein